MQDKYKHYKQLFHDELLNNVVPFWMKNGWDRELGGIYTYLDQSGKRCSNLKSVWIQSRFMWLLSALCNAYGKNEEWLQAARSCRDFLDEFCFAPDGRMYFLVTGEGKPARRRRYYFSEAFYCIGNAEYYKATGDESALENARRTYDMILSLYTDPQSDPRKMAPKYETPMRGLGGPMIMSNVTGIMRSCDEKNKEYYDESSRMLIKSIIDNFYKEDLKCVLENVAVDGRFVSDTPQGRLVCPGHSIEAAWFILDAAEYFGDKGLQQKALNIFDWSMELGWDKEHGGLVYFTDILGYPPEQYEHDMKLWWPQNEATIAALKAYRLSGEKRYFDWFETLVKYQFDNFADKEHGEWVGYLYNDNKRQQPVAKGNYFKGPFHIPRMLMECESELDTLIARG